MKGTYNCLGDLIGNSTAVSYRAGCHHCYILSALLGTNSLIEIFLGYTHIRKGHIFTITIDYKIFIFILFPKRHIFTGG